MKLFLISAAAAALVFASPAAFAQDHHRQGEGRHEESHKAPKAAPRATAPRAAAPRAAAPKAAATRPANARSRANNNRGSRAAPRTKGIVTTTASPRAVYNNAVRNDNRRDNNRRNNWNNSNRRNHVGDNRRNTRPHINYDRRNVRARHHYRYRGNPWRWPSGHSYRRWTYGMTVPSLFWGTNYWINDYSYYGLAYPPPGTVWVRYGNDAILIDRYTGEILEVVYGQFY